MLRFAPNKILNRSYSTRFLNVSETGLAFLVEGSSAPSIGDFIKVEFPVPGGQQIAWFAKVFRLEEFIPDPWWTEAHKKEHADDIIVGVQFHQLPDGHRQLIRLHLQDKFREIVNERRFARWHKVHGFLAEYGWRFLMYAFAVMIAFGIVYFLARPTPNYDPAKGTPWGQRFKIGP